MYDVHVRFIGKRAVNFLLVLTELFSLGVTAGALRANRSVRNRRFRSNEGRLTQNFRYKGSPPTNHSSSQKTRLNDLSYGIKIWTHLFYHNPRVWQTDGRTDRQTDRQTDTFLVASPRWHSMQRGKILQLYKSFTSSNRRLRPRKPNWWQTPWTCGALKQ